VTRQSGAPVAAEIDQYEFVSLRGAGDGRGNLRMGVGIDIVRRGWAPSQRRVDLRRGRDGKYLSREQGDTCGKQCARSKSSS